jgi:hypothetical protein
VFPGFQRGDIKGISRGVVEAVAVASDGYSQGLLSRADLAYPDP